MLIVFALEPVACIAGDCQSVMMGPRRQTNNKRCNRLAPSSRTDFSTDMP